MILIFFGRARGIPIIYFTLKKSLLPYPLSKPKQGKQ